MSSRSKYAFGTKEEGSKVCKGQMGGEIMSFKGGL